MGRRVRSWYQVGRWRLHTAVCRIGGWVKRRWSVLVVASILIGIVVLAYTAPWGVYPNWVGLGPPPVDAQGQAISQAKTL